MEIKAYIKLLYGEDLWDFCRHVNDALVIIPQPNSPEPRKKAKPKKKEQSAANRSALVKELFEKPAENPTRSTPAQRASATTPTSPPATVQAVIQAATGACDVEDDEVVFPETRATVLTLTTKPRASKRSGKIVRGKMAVGFLPANAFFREGDLIEVQYEQRCWNQKSMDIEAKFVKPRLALGSNPGASGGCSQSPQHPRYAKYRLFCFAEYY
ncbi:hypothetical protein Fcan01_21984 [Folsomia candida]|uniref:Uncharacterized protein n=1 Tax=Folsomia candida TaxID=158441 RepID=A0A226DF21_FOLCA|nr:hypothetical protein Fcan01_21984 [Folsomia candida]